MRGDLQEGHFYDSRCHLPIFLSTKSGFLCASYWGCWPGCGKSGLWERNTERWELKSRIGKGRVTLWGDRMCCGSRVLGSGGRIAGNLRQNAGPAGAEGLPREAEWRATGSRMAGNWEQNCWQPGAEDWFRKVKSAQLWGLRAFTICFAAWATLRKGTILPREGMWPTARADCCG